MTQQEQVEKIKSQFSDAVIDVEYDRAQCPVIWVKRESNVTLLRYLKQTDGFEYLFMADLTAYDNQGSEEEQRRGRFVVVYNLYSPKNRNRIRVKFPVPEESCSIGTAVSVWPAANWAEREVFDMYGIQFQGHPDLRRILMDIRWEGHPLRKDYPLRKYQLFVTAEPMPDHLLKEGVAEKNI